MDLYLRKVIHPQSHENYRVVLKLDGDEFEIGSIGIEHGAAWRWGIDTVIPMRVLETQAEGRDRRDCMRPVIFAEIAVRQALHAGEPASTPTPRRKPART